MTHTPTFELTPDSPSLPRLPSNIEIGDSDLFEAQWLPLSFFWLAHSLSLITSHDQRRDIVSAYTQVAKLYGLPDDLVENIIAFSKSNTDWRIRTPDLLGVRALQRRLSLSSDEYRCTAFSYLCHSSRLLEVMLNSIYRHFKDPDDLLVLSKMVGVDAITIQRMREENHRLGAMTVTQLTEQYGDEMFRMSKQIANGIDQCQTINDNILAGVLTFVSPAKVRLNQFDYLKDELTILKQCVEQTASGVSSAMQVLFIGAPGTGKTELVKALAEHANVSLVEVPVTKPNSNRDTSTYRLNEFERISQLLEGANNYQVIFDEVEDVLRQGWLDEVRKAWINKLLEQRQVTSYWVCNTTRQFEDSFLRRFDYVINMPEPDFHSRVALLQDALPNVDTTQNVIKSLAYTNGLTPAMISQLGQLVERLGSSEVPTERLVQMMLPTLPQVEADELGAFNMSDTPIKSSIPKVKLEELCKQGCGIRLLITGVSGSGKTQLARYLCHQCNGSSLFYPSWSIVDRDPDRFDYALQQTFTKSAREKKALAIDNIDHLLTAILRIMPSPDNTIAMLAELIKSADQPVILTLGAAANLADFPMVENVVDDTVQMELWHASKIRKHVEHWAQTHGVTPPQIGEHCAATAQQVIQAMRNCQFQGNITSLEQQLAGNSVSNKQLIHRVC